MSRFKKAVRQQARLRLGLDGPSGSGKSMSALRFAFAFKHDNPDIRVAAVEAGENGGLSLYQGISPDGVPFDFDILELKGNYAPTEYTNAIEEAGREKYDVLVIDSLSHAWAGAGGALEIKDRQGGNDFAAWRNVTPMHNRLIDAILQSPCHVIATLRSKTEYVLEETTNDKGRKVMVPRKIGMKPIQREGMEYEFTIFGSLDHAHNLTVTKSRCSAVQDRIESQPGLSFMLPVIEWLKTGEAAPPPDSVRRASAEDVRAIRDLLGRTGWKQDIVARGLARYSANSAEQLTAEQAAEFKGVVEKWLAERDARGASATKPAVEASPATVPANTVAAAPANGQ